MNAKNIIIIVLLLVLIGAVGFLFVNSGDNVVIIEDTKTNVPIPVESDNGIDDGAKQLEEEVAEIISSESVIGTSVNDKEIKAFHFGRGEKEILLIGGTHGSYSANTSKLGDELISYFKENLDIVPNDIMVTIIPNLNPDGLVNTGATGRFNANNVDLNRNFDCEWSESAVWKNQSVSGGSEPFSEPEALALKNYVEQHDPVAAIVWFSAEGKVYPSACDGTPSDASIKLADVFANAAEYPVEAKFDAYAITGDMVNWMAKQDIPAISVLLSDHENTEWVKNKAGVEAVLNIYTE